PTTLGVAKNASQDAVQGASRTLARLYHQRHAHACGHTVAFSRVCASLRHRIPDIRFMDGAQKSPLAPVRRGGLDPMIVGTHRTRTRSRVLGTVLDTVEALTQRASMEGNTMVADQEAAVYAGASLPVGEPVTLVIDEERFFGWVASASPAHSLA